MTKYRTTAVVYLFSGKIGLSDQQAARRPGKLKKVKGGYEILEKVCFKAGEIIELENPDKVTKQKLEAIVDVKN